MGERFPSLTKKWHSETYDAISPKRPELSAKGKVIVITGGGGSIGGAAALAFAQAGATKIAVIGRRDGPLQETKKQVESEVSGTTVLPVHGDLSDGSSMKNALTQVRESFGEIDILVANAGYLSRFQPVTEADPEEWWKGFEINTKGAFNTARALLSGPVGKDLIVVDVSTCVVHMPAMQSGSAYVSSKAASTKVWETVARENQGKLSVVHIHPGVIYSELNVKSGITASDNGECDVVFPAQTGGLTSCS